MFAQQEILVENGAKTVAEITAEQVIKINFIFIFFSYL